MQTIYKKIEVCCKRVVQGLKNSHGFTLMELMIVVTIIGILAVAIVPKIMDYPKKARISKAKSDIAAIGVALDSYNLDNGMYPTTEQGLLALIEEPSTEPVPNNYKKGGYLKKKSVPKDPWGREYLYMSPGENDLDYELITYGADGKEDGEDESADIKSSEL